MKKSPKTALRFIRPIIYAVMAFLMAFFGMRCVQSAANGIYSGCTSYTESTLYEERVQQDVNAIEEMLTQRKPDNIEFYNRSSSNFRFSVYLDDTYVFGNSEEEKLADSCRIEAFDPVNGELIYDLYYEVNTDFPIDDDYSREAQKFETLYNGRYINTTMFLVGLGSVLFILGNVIHENRKPDDEKRRYAIDAIPFDLLICICGFIAALLLIKRSGPFETEREPIILIGAIVIAIMAYVLTDTATRRGPLNSLWENTLINKMILMSPQLAKCDAKMVFYIVSAFIILMIIPIVLITLYPMSAALCYGIYSTVLLIICMYQFCAMQQIKGKFKELINGDYAHPLSDEALMGVMSDLCDDSNRIADGLKQALEKSVSSERLRIELITNVSHDLKTPLTSILNYIDLLKRDHTPQQQKEYLDILEHQANRLKKITDDVLEISKASTGNVKIEKEMTNLSELLKQAMGEYEDKLKEKQLEPVCTIEENMQIMLDGKHTWRVLDNCLNNALKYAKEGTRIYLDGRMGEDGAVITLKNVSREPLNISSDALMERFVRGDRSRNTEGSGLGLNIAQSLIQLQQGSLDIAIDGDLFKVIIQLPKNTDQKER